MSDIFAIETAARVAGLAVRAEAGFRFYASDRAFVSLEARSYEGLDGIHAEVRRLAAARQVPARARRGGKRRHRKGAVHAGA